jgi:competence protein ComEA
MATPKPNWLTHPAFVPVGIALSAMFVIAGLALAYLTFGASGGAQNATELTASNTSLQAYIVGAVNAPGVYILPDGARIHDLVAAARGVRQGADLVRVNLAAPLFDGEEVYVPLVGEPFPDNIGGNGITVNINLASAESLHLQLGISMTTADAIVSYRETHGPFTAVDQLLLVPISRTIYDKIKDLVTV